MITVGILGGGQLARMMALAGAPLGLRFLVMDSAADACAIVRDVKSDGCAETARTPANGAAKIAAIASRRCISCKL